MKFDPQDLDNHITGHYGEDQFKGQNEDGSDCEEEDRPYTEMILEIENQTNLINQAMENLEKKRE